MDFFGALLGNAGLNIAASGQRKAAKLCFEVSQRQRVLQLLNTKKWEKMTRAEQTMKRWEQLTQEEQETWIQAIGDKINE